MVQKSIWINDTLKNDDKLRINANENVWTRNDEKKNNNKKEVEEITKSDHVLTSNTQTSCLSNFFSVLILHFMIEKEKNI